MTPQSRLLVAFESFTLSFSNQRSTALLLKVLQIPSFEGRPLFLSLSLSLVLGVEPRQGVSLREAYRKLFQGLPGFPPHCHLVVKLCQEHLLIPFVVGMYDIMCMCVCPYLQMDSEKLWTQPGHMLVFPLDFEEKVE